MLAASVEYSPVIFQSALVVIEQYTFDIVQVCTHDMPSEQGR